MAALTKDRLTEQRSGEFRVDPVAAGAVLYAGALAVLDAAGNLAPGSTGLGLTARGRVEKRVDNTGGVAGDLTALSRAGVFHFANSGADPIDRSHIQGTAYIVDDQTVAATDGTGTRSAAGRIIDLDASGVWVQIL